MMFFEPMIRVLHGEYCMQYSPCSTKHVGSADLAFRVDLPVLQHFVLHAVLNHAVHIKVHPKSLVSLTTSPAWEDVNGSWVIR